MEGIWQFPTAFGGIDGCHIPKKCPHGGNEARKEYYKGACIKYLGGWGRFYKFFKKHFVPQETIDLNISCASDFLENISWPLPSILVSYLRPTSSSISG